MAKLTPPPSATFWLKASVLSLIPGAKRAVAEGAELESTLTSGRMVGLTTEETHEVIRAWTAWYASTPYPVDWRRIRSAVTLRALGRKWRPDADA